jgi:hypothetical protein
MNNQFRSHQLEFVVLDVGGGGGLEKKKQLSEKKIKKSKK